VINAGNNKTRELAINELFITLLADCVSIDKYKMWALFEKTTSYREKNAEIE